MRRGPVFLAIGVVVLAGAAAGVRFGVLPAIRQLPPDVDTTVSLTGTMDLFDTAALAAGNAAAVVRRDAPVTVAQHVKVVSVNGSTAEISDETTITGPGATTVLTSRNLWLVDRATLAERDSRHVGLVVGFPLAPQPQDYPYWDTTTQSTTTAQYRRTETHAGRETYVYELRASGPVKDPQVLSTVPTSLSKKDLLGFAAGLGPEARAMLASVEPLLPAQIPLTYSATSTMTFWVDTATGYVLDVRRTQTVAADLPAGFGALGLPTEFTVELAYTPESVAASVADATTAGDSLFLIGTLVPLALLGLAVLVLLIGLLLGARRRARNGRPDDPAPGPTADPVAPERVAG